MAVVLYTEELGVYLGSFLGLGFWSKLDPAGQNHAVTFTDVETAEKFMATWDSGRPDGVQFFVVPAGEDGFASMEACVLAGLPAWMDMGAPSANVLPV